MNFNISLGSCVISYRFTKKVSHAKTIGGYTGLQRGENRRAFLRHLVRGTTYKRSSEGNYYG